MTLPHLSCMLLAYVPGTFRNGHKGQRCMPSEHDPQTDTRHPIVYQIRLKGHMRHQWSDWFGGLSITLEDNGDTLLIGPVIDQAALYGVLRTVRDLGLPLVSVMHVDPNRRDDETFQT